MIVWLLVAGAFVATLVLTGVVRAYALQRSMLDVPNHRSSHTRPTPRGGGLAIAIALGCAVALALGAGLVSRGLGVALLGGGAMVAGIGWLDDRRGVPARWRSVVQFAAAGWVLWNVGGLPSLSLGFATVPLGVAGALLGAVGIVWVTNLYNFMDGIDGIAAGEAVTVGAIAGALLWMVGEPGLALVSLCIAAAAAGFLAWNWAPARIFMGDVGSALVGFLFAALAVASERAGALPLLAWIILLGVFVLDATTTLIRRVLRGDSWHSAHRDHAYQRAVRFGFSHAQVTTGVLLLNLVLGVAVVVPTLVPALLLPTLGAAGALVGGIYLFVERRYPLERDRVLQGADIPTAVKGG